MKSCNNCLNECTRYDRVAIKPDPNFGGKSGDWTLKPRINWSCEHWEGKCACGYIGHYLFTDKKDAGFDDFYCEDCRDERRAELDISKE